MHMFNRQLNCRGQPRSSIPPGLNELMNDISREVLDKQPNDTDLYKFIADYLDAMLTTKQRTLVSTDILDQILESSMIIGELLKRNGIDCKRASEAGRVIQDTFRNYVKNKEDKDKPIGQRTEFNEFHIFQQLVVKCNFREDELVTVKEVIRVGFRDFFRKYSNYLRTAYVNGPGGCESVERTMENCASRVTSYEKLNKAATKIQSVLRMRLAQKMKTALVSDLQGEKSIPGQNKFVASIRKSVAASVIQKAYRAYKDNQKEERRRCEERKKEVLVSTQQLNSEEAAAKIQLREAVLPLRTTTSRPWFSPIGITSDFGETSSGLQPLIFSSADENIKKAPSLSIICSPSIKQDITKAKIKEDKVRLEKMAVETTKSVELSTESKIKLQQITGNVSQTQTKDTTQKEITVKDSIEGEIDEFKIESVNTSVEPVVDKVISGTTQITQVVIEEAQEKKDHVVSKEHMEVKGMRSNPEISVATNTRSIEEGLKHGNAANGSSAKIEEITE